MDLYDNPHASRLAHLIVDSWAKMTEHWGVEAAQGLSVRQVGRFLGPRTFNGGPRLVRHAGGNGYGPIAGTLAWLARREVLLEPVKGRYFLAPGMQPAIKLGMTAQINNLRVVRQFFQPTTASTTVTVVSKKTGTRFTYDVKRKEPRPGSPADEVWYVDLLNGPDNRDDFTPLAVLTRGKITADSTEIGPLVYHHAARSRIGDDAPSARGLRWIVNHVVAANDEAAQRALEQFEVYHEGRCARCGRKLTVPHSIQVGLGPDCEEKVLG